MTTAIAPLPGRATPAGTTRYAERFFDAAAGHFRAAWDGLRVPSLGLGTGGIRSDLDQAARDRAMAAIYLALRGGLGLIDTAINYGRQLAETLVGSVVREAVVRGDITRDEVVVVTKGGYLPYDSAEIEARYVTPGLCHAGEVVSGHCLAPAVLREQIAASRRNLGLDTIDLYLLHNPEEQQDVRDAADFTRVMRRALEALEQARGDGWIAAYGVATAEVFRQPSPGAHAIDRLLALAREVGGERHGFRAVELPLSLVARETLVMPSHRGDGREAPAVEAAAAHGLAVLASASLAQGRAIERIPDVLRQVCPDVHDAALLAMQFVRSGPGVTCALVGSTDPEHVAANACLRRVAPLDLSVPAT